MSVAIQQDASAQLQSRFARHLRNPSRHEAPDGIEERRLQVYRDLVYNNIEGFLANGFPVLRKIYADTNWHAMVRDFVDRHQSHSPYFLSIGAEFIDYLRDEREAEANDPPFLLELACYEWAELALFVAEEPLPSPADTGDPALLEAIPRLSPLAWSMVFEFPVHQIGPDNQPQSAADQPVCLVVYRNRDEKVRFLEINPVTARLIELCEENREESAARLLEILASELPGIDAGTLQSSGEATLAQLRNLDIIQFYRAG